MPLPLGDTRWSELQASYGGTADVVAWLRQAYETRSPSAELIGNLINEVQHQGDTSTAMYAVAVHFVALARDASPACAVHLLTSAGMTYADSSRDDAAPCPAFLEHEFRSFAVEGARLLASHVATMSDFPTFKYAVAALAGFEGHHAFGRLIANLDYFEGRFHHPSLDEPISE